MTILKEIQEENKEILLRLKKLEKEFKELDAEINLERKLDLRKKIQSTPLEELLKENDDETLDFYFRYEKTIESLKGKSEVIGEGDR